jgi:hypothetical protein
MRIKYYLFLMICAAVLVYGYSQAAPAICSTKEQCKDLSNNCMCYCSHICSPRAKTVEDDPVYYPNDPAGHYCYCKPWDLAEYTHRCELKEKGKKKEVKAKKSSKKKKNS